MRGMKIPLQLDTDGDKVLRSTMQMLINAVVDYGYITDQEEHNELAKEKNAKIELASKKPHTIENRLAHFEAIAEGSKVGYIANMTTRLTDMALHSGNRMLLDNVLSLAPIFAGMTIDTIKTGVEVTLPANFVTPYIPHWMLEMRELQDRYINTDNLIPYISNSALGKICNAVLGVRNEKQELVGGLLNEFMKEFKFDIMPLKNIILNNITVDPIAMDKLYSPVKDVMSSYNREISELLSSNVDKEERKKRLSGIIDSNIDKLYGTCVDIVPDVENTTISALAYTIAYTEFEKGHKQTPPSFPWLCAFDGLDRIFSTTKSTCTIYVNGVFEGDYVNAIDGVLYDEDGKELGSKDYIADGEYEVFEVEGKMAIEVNTLGFISYESLCELRNIKLAEMKGIEYTTRERKNTMLNRFVNLHGGTARSFVEKLNSINNEMNIITVGNQLVAVDNNGNRLANKVFDENNVSDSATNNVKVKVLGYEGLTRQDGTDLKSIRLTLEVLGYSDVQPNFQESEYTFSSLESEDEEYYNTLDDSNYYEYTNEEDVIINDSSIISLDAPVKTIEFTKELHDKFNANNLSYWNVDTDKAFDLPARMQGKVKSREVKILNPNAVVGEIVGRVIVNSIKSNGEILTLSSNVTRTAKGLEVVKENYTLDLDFMADWIKRVISFESYKMRELNK